MYALEISSFMYDEEGKCNIEIEDIKERRDQIGEWNMSNGKWNKENL